MTGAPQADPLARLAAWRSDDGWRLDPARFHYLEALARRAAGQPEPVRRLLHARLESALAEYGARLAARPPAPAGKPRLKPVPARPACAPLAQLNDYLREAAAARLQAAAPGEAQEPHELASVLRFRHALAGRHAQDQVLQAAARQPANPGPLNSQRLVLQSLELMQALSPAYLRRFLVHVESLQWLDRAAQQYPAPQARQAAGRKAAAKKTARARRPKK